MRRSDIIKLYNMGLITVKGVIFMGGINCGQSNNRSPHNGRAGFSMHYAFVMKDAASFADEFLFNDEVKPWLLIFGSIGQVLFTMRFIYQWLYSRKKKESQLPEGFWLISLIGSFLILMYGCLRADLVLIVGQMFGVIIYLRNIYLITNGEKRVK